MSRPWMPLYVADYLADTGHLSTIEHGAYLLLIMHYWQNTGLPKEDAKLARITRTTPREWAAMRDTLAEFFEPGWIHARIDRELGSAEAAYQRRAKAGAKGGNAGAMLRRTASKALAPLKQSQPHSQKEEEPSRKQRFQDVARGGTSCAADPHGDDAFAPAPPPDPAAWTDNAPLGRDAAAGGAR
ncbi:DUF1376 domain-containing protein [Methylobacterium sp. NMS12]|uniref:YdaU family protein n=1 Tax=Methylobacterium sp. NMS12 TaxID=3079766 RepID=UPI003F88135D